MKARHIVILSVLFVFFMISVVYVHELVHIWDFRNVAKNGTLNFCILRPCMINDTNLGKELTAGNFKFTYDIEDYEEVKKIMNYTEIHAYIATFIYAGLFLILELYLINKFIKNRKRR